MATELARIAELSAQNPTMVFTSIAHLINVKLLRECHEKMDADKAVGIDGVTKEEYEEKLEENLVDLVDRMKKKSYKPKPARRVEIPKDNGKTRPLSIYCYEDKLVQEALRRVLEAVYEPMFYDEMMGFRPGRSCHQALRKLNTMIERNYTNYILDADIKLHIRANRRRIRPRVGLLSNIGESVHALCIDLVVQGENTAVSEGI